MSMKKRTAILSAIILLVSSLAGCGESGTVISEADDHVVTATKNEGITEDADSDTASNQNEAGISTDNDRSGQRLFGDGQGDAEGSDALRMINTYFDESKYTEDKREIYFQCFGNHILCSFDAEKQYPRLAKTLRELADDEEKFFRNEIRDSDSDALDFAKDMRADGTEAYYSHYASDVLKRADSKCVSIVRIMNGYLGGAHPDYYYETYNISSKTGSKIKLSDVINSQEDLNKILEQKLLADYPDVEFFGLSESLADYDMSINESGEDAEGNYLYAYDFTLDPDGIAFYFSPYGISAYAYGDQVVKILYDEEPSLFKEDYSAGGGYISYLTDRENKYATQSIAESISISKDDYDENGSFKKIEVEKAGRTVEIGDLYFYGLTAYILSDEEYGDFVYLIASTDNDWRQLFVVDINKDKPELVDVSGNLSYTYNEYIDGNNGIYGSVLPTDANGMELAARCDLLSTYNAYGSFKAASDGTPELIGKYLTVPNGYVLTSLADLETEIVDDDGKTVERSVTIPKGEEFTLYRTDGSGIVDAKLSDGRIVRLNVSKEYPHVVNGGLTDEKLFDGLRYAG